MTDPASTPNSQVARKGTAPDTPESTAFAVGVDGGGTGSRAQVLDLAGRRLFTAEGPPALVLPTDPGAAARALADTVRAAMEGAGVSPPARVLWAGLAGAGRRGPREAVEIALRSLGLAETVQVGMDVEGAHWDAFRGEAGVLLVLGTGSMVWGRDPEGREIRVGGWGDLLGDEAGGYWMGREALRVVARAHDGREGPSLLSATVLEALHLPDPPSLISWVAGASKGEVAALAPLVLEAAAKGDRPAGRILFEGLTQLRNHLDVVRRAWEPWGPPIPMAMVGGLVVEGSPLRDRVAALMEEMGGQLRDEAVIPVRGAALKALSLAGNP